MNIRCYPAALTGIALLLAGCASSPTGRSQLMLVSPATAIASSKQAYLNTLEPLEKKGKVDNHPRLTERVKRVTGRIVSQAIERYPKTRRWDWTIKVIDDNDTVNAWCMAGGRMAVYSGLIKKLDPSDDELAVVMGHEIAHAVANHVAEKMSIAMATRIGVAGTEALARNSRYHDLALTGAGLAAVLAVELPYSRTVESEADRIGLELTARAGYDPRAALSLWDKMAREADSNPPEFLSTHPSPVNRQRDLAKQIPSVMRYYREDKPHPVYAFK